MSGISVKLLRSTPEAEAWISQFEAQDRSTAAFALESLVLVSHTTFQNGVLELLRHARTKVKDNRPVALFAAREADEEEEVIAAEEDVFAEFYEPDNWDEPLKPVERVRTIELPYFHPTDDSRRPNAAPRGAGIGSEGPVANLIRDLWEEEGTVASPCWLWIVLGLGLARDFDPGV